MTIEITPIQAILLRELIYTEIDVNDYENLDNNLKDVLKMLSEVIREA